MPALVLVGPWPRVGALGRSSGGDEGEGAADTAGGVGGLAARVAKGRGNAAVMLMCA